MGDHRIPIFAGPSVRERMQALQDHVELFEMIAEFPHAGVHERFLKERAVANAYVESKVIGCWRFIESFVKSTLESEASNDEDSKYIKLMDSLVENLLLHEAHVTESFQRMAQSPLPSADFMDLYRICSHVEKPGMRAANGEMASRYSQRKQPVPQNLGVMDHESLAPMAHFVYEWIVKPVHDYFETRSGKILKHLPMYKAKEGPQDCKDGFVTKGTILALTNALGYILVTFILVAPIATFNVVGSQTTRIVVMPLFCLLLIASAQCMGSKSRFVATLATSYFQAMVVYVGTTSDRQAGP